MPALVLFIIAVILWVAIAITNRDPGPPPVSPAYPTVSALLTLLGLVNHVRLINETQVEVPPNSLSPQGAVFLPQVFITRNGITNVRDVQSFDEKAQTIYVGCAYQVLSSGESNPIAMREKRVSCLLDKGYNSNDIAYIGGKFI
jgi:hypothetical protein